MGETDATVTIRHLPLVVFATLVVAVSPAAVVWLLASDGSVTGFLPLVGIGLLVSVAINIVGRAAWKAKPGGSDLLFSDLMLWGWARRLRIERRLGSAVTILGLDGQAMRARLDPGVRIDVLRKLATSLESRDPYLHGHSRRVARYAAMIAKEMELPGREVGKIRTAAAVHDVGKLETPLAVLNKPGRLTDDEFDVIKVHAPRGAEMVSDLGDRELTEMVAHHHERLDGSGYPSRLAGEDIPLGARIIAVADTFDALTSTRAYRSAKRHKEALSILHAEAGTQLDPKVVSAFDRCYQGSLGGLTVWALFAGLPHRLWAPIDSQLQAAAGSATVTKAMTVVVATTAAAGGVAVSTDAADPRDSNGCPTSVRRPRSPATLARVRRPRGEHVGGDRHRSLRARPVPFDQRRGRRRAGRIGPERSRPGSQCRRVLLIPRNGDRRNSAGSAFGPAAQVTYPPSSGVGGSVADVPGPTPAAPGPGWEASVPVETKPVKPDGPGNSGHDGTSPGNSGHDGTGPGNSGHGGGLPGNSDHGGSGPGNSGHDDDHPGNSEGGGKPDGPKNPGHGNGPGWEGGKPDSPGNSGHR